MSKFVMAAALAAAMATAGAAGAQERDVKALHGAWTVDVEKTVAAVLETMPELGELGAEERAQLQRDLAADLASTEFVFAETTLTTRSAGDEDDAEDLRIVSHEGAKWKLETKSRPEEGEEPEARTIELEWFDDDHVKFTPEGEAEVSTFLVRKK